MATQSPQVLQPCPLVSRAEIDTSAPFESVKEAANLFGGMGFCRKPISHRNYNSSQNADEQHDVEIVGIVEVGEQAVQLERDLIAKEREARQVLKELITIKNIVEELKLKLHGTLKENPYDNKENIVAQEGRPKSDKAVHPNGVSTPAFILFELKKAKLNLTRTTNDLADIRDTVDLYNKKIEKQRMSLEKTRRRLSSSALKIPCPEDEINQERGKQDGSLTDTDSDAQGSSHDPMNITRELQKLSSETEQFKGVGEAAKSKVLRAISEIEQTKNRIRNAEIRLVAAKRMKEAAKASEAVALAEIKALSKSENKGTASQKNLEVTLTFEEYSCLVSKAQEGEKACPGTIVDTMPGQATQVDEANLSKTEILKRVAEATEEVKTSKKALEEALSRVEAATRGKLEVEDALRMWRSNHRHKRRGSSSHNCTRSKKCHPSACRKESRPVEASGVSLGNDELKPVLKPSLSIGKILGRKLLLTEECGNEIRTYQNIMCKHKVSLGQMLQRRSADWRSAKISGKENGELPEKRKKLGVGRIPLFVAQQIKKKKNSVGHD